MHLLTGWCGMNWTEPTKNVTKFAKLRQVTVLHVRFSVEIIQMPLLLAYT